MYAVSPEFLAAMIADLRHVKCRVTIDYTDPFIDQSITTTVNEQARISWPSQTANSRIAVPYWWAALDGTWKAGDGRHPMPDTEDAARLHEAGWWGATPAGTSGAFASPYPTLTVSHSPRPVHSLRVAGDSARNEYPVDFVVRLKDNASAVLHEETVTGNTKLDWAKALTSPVLEVASQELEIRKWSTPGRVVKITEFFTSIREVYDHDDIVSARMLEEREPNHGMVVIGAASANEVGVVLSNADHRFDEDNDASHLYRLIKPNRRVKVELGTEVDGVDEWVPLGTYWVADWNTQDLETSLRALDILELLRTTKFLGGRAQQNITVQRLAELVLSDAGLTVGEYVVDPGLEDIIIPWAWFPAGNYQDALSTIAEAGLAAVWADREGKVHVERLDTTPGESALTITGDDYFPPLRVTSHHEQTINEVIVATQPMQPATTDEVYRTTMRIPANSTVSVTAVYTQPPVFQATASVTGASVEITDADYFTGGAVVSIKNSAATESEATLTINGLRLASASGVKVTARDEISYREHGPLSYEYPSNPLIQTAQHAQALADRLLAVAAEPSRNVELEWRGNPALEVGDTVTVVTDAKHDRRSDYRIVRQELQWAGALSATLTGRRITGQR